MDTVRRLLLAGIGAGLLAGLVVSIAQFGTTTPLILAAETYETPGAGHAPDRQSTSVPEADPARIAGTILANLVTGAGFGLLLVAAFAVRGEAPGAMRGLAWGAAGFVAVALAPALGLPPELPGSRAAALEARQLWWLGTVLATAGALWLLAFGGRYRLLGLLVLPIPHLFGAPRSELVGGSPPPELAAHFAAASLVVGAIFWTTLGASAGWLSARVSNATSWRGHEPRIRGGS
jgi:cobalt transporter subunit CbtA